MTVFQAAPMRKGIFVVVGQDENGLVGTVIAAKEGNVLSHVHRGPLGGALARGKQASEESGFEGYYEIEGVAEIKAVKPAEYAEATQEIAHQTSALQHKAGSRWGFNPQYGPEQFAAMPAAQAHVSRLSKLSDTLQRALAL
jgi:hypothetical protein